VLEAVRTCVDPKVIDCPNPASGKTEVAAVAKDGIQVLAKARVTVRTNINRLIGGATEETIIARVGEGIVSTIGSSNSHKDVLENPDNISKTVLSKGLDAGTAFEILSIDIADVDIGKNIGARLQADQAEADKRIAQAKAEERRAMAVAHEQEMKAEVMSNRAKVVLAEAQVPTALAKALESRQSSASWTTSSSRTSRRTRACVRASVRARRARPATRTATTSRTLRRGRPRRP
jgi:uncharacterized protein YqfA (UPF0365 family)